MSESKLTRRKRHAIAVMCCALGAAACGERPIDGAPATTTAALPLARFPSVAPLLARATERPAREDGARFIVEGGGAAAAHARWRLGRAAVTSRRRRSSPTAACSSSAGPAATA